MKKTLLRALLVVVFVGFSLLPLGLNGLGLSAPATASTLFAQTPTPQITPSSSPTGTTPVVPNPTNSPSPKATQSPNPNPVPPEVEPSTTKTGPYDMEAIKAFNRALYGS